MKFTCLAFICILVIVSAASDINIEKAIPTKTPVTLPCSNEIDGHCIKWAISKLLGLAIVAVSCLLKVPIIKNMITDNSAGGLELDSLYLDLVSYACTTAYNVLIFAPLTTYAETIIISVQMIVMIVLTWNFNKIPTSHRIAFILSVIAFVISVYFLPKQYWSLLMGVSTLTAVASRISQIKANIKQQHTGVLALSSVLLQVAGNAIRIFTTFTEVNDIIVLGSFVVSFILNSTISSQIIYYSKNTQKLREQNAKNKQD